MYARNHLRSSIVAGTTLLTHPHPHPHSYPQKNKIRLIPYTTTYIPTPANPHPFAINHWANSNEQTQRRRNKIKKLDKKLRYFPCQDDVVLPVAARDVTKLQAYLPYLHILGLSNPIK